MPSLLAASDVLGTGWFGAVGLLGILAAKQIIALSRHEARQQLAREFGATDIVAERGDEGVAAVKELTDGLGAHSVIEAVAARTEAGCRGGSHNVRHTVNSAAWQALERFGLPNAEVAVDCACR